MKATLVGCLLIVASIQYLFSFINGSNVYIFGDNTLGMFFDGTEIPSPNITKAFTNKIGSQFKFKSIITIHRQSIALAHDGFIYTTGPGEDKDKLELTDFEFKRKPLYGTDDDENFIVDLASGEFHILARNRNNKVFFFGSNKFGQGCLGTQKENYFDATLIPYTIYNPVKQIGACHYHSMFLTIENELFSCGDAFHGNGDEQGIVQVPLKVNTSIVQQVDATDNIKGISVGMHFYIVLTEKGRLYFTGKNYTNMFTNDIRETLSPFNVVPGTIKNLVVEHHSVIYDTIEYGLIQYDMMTKGNIVYLNQWIPHKMGDKYSYMVIPDMYVVFLQKNNEVYAWGSNEHILDEKNRKSYPTLSQLEFNDYAYHESHVEEEFHAIAINVHNNALYSKGYNTYGQIGIGRSNLFTKNFTLTQSDAIGDIEIVDFSRVVATICDYAAIDNKGAIHTFKCYVNHAFRHIEYSGFPPDDGKIAKLFKYTLPNTMFFTSTNHQLWVYESNLPYLEPKIVHEESCFPADDANDEAESPQVRFIFCETNDEDFKPHTCHIGTFNKGKYVVEFSEGNRFLCDKTKHYPNDKTITMEGSETEIFSMMSDGNVFTRKRNNGEENKLFENAGQMSAGLSHLLLLSNDKIPYGHGYNDLGQLGTNDGERFHSNPVEIKIKRAIYKNDKVIHVYAESLSSFCITENGVLYMWGYGPFSSASNVLDPAHLSDFGIVLEPSPPLQSQIDKKITSVTPNFRGVYFLTGVTCFNMSKDDLDVCNRRGTCFNHDSCSCNPGFYGKNCSYDYTCFDRAPDDPRACYNGNCIYQDKCECYLGYLESSRCRDAQPKVSPAFIVSTSIASACIVFLAFAFLTTVILMVPLKNLKKKIKNRMNNNKKKQNSNDDHMELLPEDVERS